MKNIISDMKIFREHNIDGFVFGSLTENREIDVPNSKLVIENAHGLPVTFHRAFDMSIPSQMHANVKLIAELGFQRLLTSGLAETAELGIDVLKELNLNVLNKSMKLIVMPGCGINPENLEKVLRVTCCREIHGSARVERIEEIKRHASDTSAISTNIDSNSSYVADWEIVQNLVRIKTDFLGY